MSSQDQSQAYKPQIPTKYYFQQIPNVEKKKPNQNTKPNTRLQGLDLH